MAERRSQPDSSGESEAPKIVFPDLYDRPSGSKAELTQHEMELLALEDEQPAGTSPGSRASIPAAQVVRPTVTRFQFPKWLGNTLFYGGLALLSVSLYLKLVEPRSNELARTADLPVAGRVVEGTAGPVISLFGDLNDPAYRELERMNGIKLSQLARQGRVRVVRYQLPPPTGRYALTSRLASRAALCVDRKVPQFAPGVRIAVSRIVGEQTVSEQDILDIIPPDARKAVEACVISEGEALLKAEAEMTLRAGYVKSPYVALDGVPYERSMDELIADLSPR